MTQVAAAFPGEAFQVPACGAPDLSKRPIETRSSNRKRAAD